MTGPRLIFLACLLGIMSLLAVSQRDRLRALWQGGTFKAQVLAAGMDRQRDVMIPMPDGVRLATDIYLPKQAYAPVPTLLIRLPYGKDDFEGALWWVRAFGPSGYAVVVQDLRGRYGSDGVFAPYAHVAGDGAATMDWIAAQEWSDGGIATAGCSALGEVQLMQAKAGNPHLRAMIAEGAGGAIGTGGASRGYFGLFEGGIPNLAAAYGWFSAAGGKTRTQMQEAGVDPAEVITDLPSGTLVARHRDDPTDYEDFLSHFEDPAYWRDLGYLTAQDRFAAPALHVNTWHDIAVRGTFEAAALMRQNAVNDVARDHQHVLIGPGLHCAVDAPFIYGRVGDLPVSPESALDYDAIYRGWLDHWLRGAPLPDLAQYTYFLLGADRWESAAHWPPADVSETRFYLGQGGTLSQNVAAPGSAEYAYDPNDPTPSIGGPICCTGGLDLPAGPLDQRANDPRADVLSFASEPLTEAMNIVGDIRAEIAFASDAPDTDLVAILLDIGPDGERLTIQQGALRLRYRDGFDAPMPLVPGKTVTVTVAFAPIAYQIKAGHQIGLHLSSASFPRLERNLNTKGPNYLATLPRIAVNSVFFGGMNGSALILPVQAHDAEKRAD
ncbi:MAG: CocE/NonD family hydrolase [Rhodobacterales bacterium]|nr:CocE/NonD family hydrolase [Rhodobacterales bacterium]